MRKFLRPFVLGVMLATGMTAGLRAVAASALDQVHRPFYGYFLNNSAFDRQWGVARQYFDTCYDSELLFDHSAEGTYGVYAGAGIDGILYLCPYLYISSLEAPKAQEMFSYNTYNGRVTKIGMWNTGVEEMKPTDMTYDYVSKKLYAIGYEYGSKLFEVNPETGLFTHLCDLQDGATLAASPAGELYTIGNTGILYRINRQTGVLTQVFDTGLSGMMSLQTMEFDRGNGKLYWASNCHSNDTYDVQLQEIDLSDPNNITMTQLGPIGINATFMSMYIPAASSFSAPAAPSQVTAVTPDPEKLSATISWTNPTTDFAGNAIDRLNGVVLFRNGEQVKLFTDAAVGQEMTYEDNAVPTNGEYRYDVIAFNGNGDGEKGSVFAYVGKDAPGEVGDVAVATDADFMGASLSWTAPVTGKHEGVFVAADVRYNVIRRPDNRTVAQGIAETTFHDTNIRRLLNYWYDIEAYNEVGSTTVTTGARILGPALETPVEEDFEDQQAIPNRWMTFDANNDSYSWIFYSTMSHDIFGDYERGAEYILTPTSVDSRLCDADDWLISAPVKFEADKKYEFSIYARAYTSRYTPVKVELCFGATADYADMTKLADAAVELPYPDPETGTAGFMKYTADIPQGSTIGCVGVHLVEPVPDDFMCFLQIGNVEVKEKNESGIADVKADGDVVFSLAGKTLSIHGNISAGALYSVDGRYVASLGAVNDLGNLASGVYIAVVNGRSYKFVL